MRRVLWILYGTAIIGMMIGHMVRSAPTSALATASLAPSPMHWLGRSPYGHDLLALLTWAGGRTLMQSVAATALTVAIGVMIGALRANDRLHLVSFGIGIVGRLLDTLGILLIGVTFAALFPRASDVSLTLVLSFLAWPSVAAVTEAAVRSFERTPLFESAVALGLTRRRIFVFYQVPQVAPALYPLAAGMYVAYLTTFGALGFLGVGAQAELQIGFLLYDSLSHLQSAGHYFWCTLAMVIVLILPAAMIDGGSLAR